MKADELNNKYKLDSIYIISCNNSDGKKKRGTCFSISKKHVITAFHVIRDMVNFNCFLTTDNIVNDISLPLKVIIYNEELDIAILELIDGEFNDFIYTSDVYIKHGLNIQSCGFPREKENKHATIDTSISNTYDCIETESYSFEINQVLNIRNYKGMSGSPLIYNGYAIGVLLVQQGGTSLYCVSFTDILKKTTSIADKCNIQITNNNPQHVLFNHYTRKCDDYYLVRHHDHEFNSSLQLNNVWVFGRSGVGKTALINRNLTINDVEYCYCDLSPITVSNENDVLIEILVSIEEKFNAIRDDSEKNIIKQITNILCKSNVKKIVIVIDELGVNDKELLKKIAESLMRLVSYVTRNHEEDSLKFAVSTILSPCGLLSNKAKASDYFQFLCCDSWDSNLDELFELLCINLRLNLEYLREHIISSSNDSPRILKTIFRKIISANDTSEESINNAIDKTLEEAVL